MDCAVVVGVGRSSVLLMPNTLLCVLNTSVPHNVVDKLASCAFVCDCSQLLDLNPIICDGSADVSLEFSNV